MQTLFVGLVEPCAHVLGEIRTYRCFLPRARAGREHRHDQGRALQRAGCSAVSPRIFGDHLAGRGIGDPHAVPPGRGQKFPAVPLAAGEVPVRVDLDTPVPVGFPAFPTDRVETCGWQGHQRFPVLVEAFHNGHVQ